MKYEYSVLRVVGSDANDQVKTAERDLNLFGMHGGRVAAAWPDGEGWVFIVEQPLE